MARRVRRKGKPRPASRYTGLINYPTSSRFSRSCEETGWNLGTPFKRFPSPSTFVSRSEYDRLFRRAIFTGGREIVANSPPPWKPVPSELDPSSGDASFFFFFSLFLSTTTSRSKQSLRIALIHLIGVCDRYINWILHAFPLYNFYLRIKTRLLSAFFLFTAPKTCVVWGSGRRCGRDHLPALPLAPQALEFRPVFRQT